MFNEIKARNTQTNQTTIFLTDWFEDLRISPFIKSVICIDIHNNRIRGKIEKKLIKGVPQFVFTSKEITFVFNITEFTEAKMPIFFK